MKSKTTKAAGKASLRPLVGSAWDDAFAALRAVKDKAHIPNEHSVALRDSCRDMQEGIRKMLAYSPIRGERDEANDLRRLNERMEQICELSNMMECGSLMIEIERAMQTAYKRMP